MENVVTNHPDYQAFVRAVCESPADDTPRLVFADWLDEHNQPERAEFVRVQCELWRHPQQSAWLEQMPVEQWVGDAAEGELLRRLDPLVRRHTELCHLYVRDCARWSREFIRGILGRGWLQRSATWEWGWSRGFIESVTCTAADWLAHADALTWHPGQTVECPACKGEGAVAVTGRASAYQMSALCLECRDGRVPRPCPPTAQPITSVTITDDVPLDERFSPDGFAEWRLRGREGSMWFSDEERFYNRDDRSIVQVLLETEWPGVNFKLPAAGPLVRPGGFLTGPT